MRRFWLSLAFLILPAMTQAQSTVRGIVVDRLSGAPVAHALLGVTGTRSSATTDDAGRFTLTAPAAITSVTVAAVGYASRQVTVANGSAELRIELAPAQTELPGVQVLAQVPEASTAIVTKNDLQRFSGVSLTDALNTVPGVFMQTRTPFGGARITMRGYYPSTSGNSPNSNGLGYNAFLDNIPVTDATGTTVLDDVDFSTLGNVSLIKGPASSLYGSAIGGTVRMATARPAQNETSVSQQYLTGGNGLVRSNTTFQSANGASDFVLNYGYQGDDSFRPHSQSRKYYVRANGDYTVAANQTISAYFSYNRSYEELAGEIDSADFYARRPVSDANYLANNSHIAITSVFTGVSDSHRFSEHFSNTTSVFASGRFSNQPFAHGFTDATQVNFGARTSFMFNGTIGDVGVDGTVGLMAQRSNVQSNGVFITPAPPYPERPSASENVAANSYAFTEWKFAFPQQIALTVGGSLIANAFSIQNMLKSNQLFDTTTVLTKNFATVFAPRAELTKGIGSDASVYASVSTGYTPPLLTQVTASDGTVNNALKPEHAVQYEIGVQGRLLKTITGQLAWYSLDNTDKLVSQAVSGISSTVNVGEQKNQGIEASLSWLAMSDTTQALSLLRPWLSYTSTDAKYVTFKSDNNNNASTVDFSGKSVARVPKTMYAVGVDAAMNNGLTFASTYTFVDKVPVTFDNSTWVRSYTLLSAKLGYRMVVDKDWTLNLQAGGDNLGGSTYYNFLFVGPNYKGLAQGPDGGTGDGYILPGTYAARYYANIGLSYKIR